MFKKFAMIALCVAALSLNAQNEPRVESVNGSGMAASTDNRVINFGMRALKVTRENQTRVMGNAVVREMGTNNRPGTAVELRHVERMNVDGKLATFGGKGFRVVATPEGPRRINGQVVIRVEDNRTPENGQTPDRVKVNFTPAEGPGAYEFEGTVRRGDIAVRVRG